MRRQHRFQDGELRHQDAQDFSAPPQQARRFINLVARCWVAANACQASHDGIQVVQQFFEPELVRLMDHDEQQFVMPLRLCLQLLQLQQFRNSQIRAVG